MSNLDGKPLVPHPPVVGLATTAKDHSALHCRIVAETDKAILVEEETSATEHWFPLSHVSYIHRQSNDGMPAHYGDTIHVANWLLKKKGLSK